jgi:hypothetical protein
MRILRYPLTQRSGRFFIEVPIGAVAKSVALNPSGVASVYMQVPTTAAQETVERGFLIVMTGEEFPAESMMRFIGTFLEGALVSHLYELMG